MGALQHPVADVLRRRRDEGSRPGARTDADRVALVLEGGGMRGVVSAGMAAALERLGLTPAFDLVVGSSAGALNGAGLLVGLAARGPGTYAGVLASRAFINPARLLVGRPAVDLRMLLDHAAATVDGDRERAAVDAGAPLWGVVVDAARAEPVTFDDLTTRERLWPALMATMRMPLFGGGPVEVDGRRCIDGALAEPIPVAAALAAGATHVLVLQTRPHGVPRTTGSWIAERLVERHLRGLNPALERLWRERAVPYERLVADIARHSSSPGEPPHVLGLRPPAGTPVVGQLERRPEVLLRAADAAARLVDDALAGDESRPARAEAAR